MSASRSRARRLVLDASVLLKGFLPEEGHAEARRLLEGRWTFLAPDLILPEAANAVWKKRRRGELSAATALRIVRAVRRAPIRFEPAAGLLTRAFAIATAADRTVYDSLYVALAARHRCAVATADARLWNALKGGELGPCIRWFADPALLDADER
jgi:predicted nucleic acid-binding protein